MIVTDASVLVPALADDGPAGSRVRDRLRHEELVAPEILDIEFVSVLRRLVRVRQLSAGRALQALHELRASSLHRQTHRPLLGRIWDLRDNLSAYDAAYVAMAEELGAVLLTFDRGIVGAPGIRCNVELLS